MDMFFRFFRKKRKRHKNKKYFNFRKFRFLYGSLRPVDLWKVSKKYNTEMKGGNLAIFFYHLMI